MVLAADGGAGGWRLHGARFGELAEPEKHLTRIQGSKLWHLALLELWLQRNVAAA